MSQLLQAYDAYHDLTQSGYFTYCFDRLPSKIFFEASLRPSKEQTEEVLQIILSAIPDMEIMYKNWKTDNSKNADQSKDYPYKYLLKHPSEKLLVWIDHENNKLEVTFLYHVSDSKTEETIFAVNQKLRTSFGTEKSPVFKVLCRNHGFYTEDVKTEAMQLDINANYNDDFVEVHETIESHLQSDQSGIILLHGIPGTGKTSYIKHLITQFEDVSFIYVQNEFINRLLDPEFISFLLDHRNAVLVVEDAEKVITSREYSNESSVVSTILQLTDGLFSDYMNIKIICTFNTEISKIDQALMRKGRMIASYDFKKLSEEKTNQLLKEQGHSPADEAMTLANIFNYQNPSFTDTEEKKKGIGFK